MTEILAAVVRSSFIILGLFFITKLLGKKQLSKLSFFEYIVGITVGDIAGTLSMDPELSLRDGITALLIWAFVPLFISILSLKSKPFRDFVEGKPTTFIEKGKILEDNLRKEKFSADELMEQLRKKDIFRVADVEFASLDSNGELNIILKKAKQPLTAGDLFDHFPEAGVPHAVIMDGTIYYDALKNAGVSREWLSIELAKRQVEPENVFFAQIDEQGQLKIDLYNDSLKIPEIKQDEHLLILMKKIHSELEWNSMTAQEPVLKTAYKDYARRIDELITKAKPYFSLMD
ncbi:DUF421 domain-containing protein [Bacillus sp. ISL-47]|uniref:DUF421 domain-containing protein n=1 Tax=Bacillus sp. ISL-47 TaxID=2819130 RepID=UPI001BECCEFB|nr:DUF421 domain-containing protein [Bacillus sp. ISL-47]MBT2688308.1 DUF421 domain-containing protein [Bacillus sp. ISL-47]MBT2710101.1 DUF421 domain-containing protein [Pseudomonas sp. ISL-84]